MNAMDEDSTWRYAPLHLAALLGYAEIARKLVEAGADMSLKNQHDDTAVLVAACKGHVGDMWK